MATAGTPSHVFIIQHLSTFRIVIWVMNGLFLKEKPSNSESESANGKRGGLTLSAFLREEEKEFAIERTEREEF
jgi:hypothetical protein